MVYADLVQHLDAEQRAQLDEELALPLGVTRDSLAADTAAWTQAQGWVTA